MDWITADIAVGNYLEAQNASLLKEQGICSVLGLDRTLENHNGTALGLADMEVVPLEDGPGNDLRLFRLAVGTLERLVREHRPVLVHCHAGRSRSVVVVAAYLMNSLGIEAHEALELVAAKRPIAVTPGLERLLDHFL